jgi:hypothetical protein
MAINEKAMLVRLTISRWVNRATDTDGTRAVADKFQININEGAYVKSLIAPAALKEITAATSNIRSFHYEQTLPWADEGVRIITSTNYFQFLQGMRERIDKFDIAVNAFAQQYPALKLEAQSRKGGLFKEKDYPNPQELRNMFKASITFMPFPTTSDFRVDIPEAELKEIKKQTEQTLDQVTKQSVTECLSRLYEAVNHMSKRLSTYHPRSAPFRDSLVDNVQVLAELLPRLNLTSDKTLDTLCTSALALCQSSPDTLRHDEDRRTKIATEANALVNKIRKHKLFNKELLNDS